MRSLELPAGIGVFDLGGDRAGSPGTTEFSCDQGCSPMSSLTCRAMRMVHVGVRRARCSFGGRFADVLADLAQRAGRLRDERGRHLEVVDLAGPPGPRWARPAAASRRAASRASCSRTSEPRDVDQRARQAGLDVVERFVDPFGLAVDDSWRPRGPPLPPAPQSLAGNIASVSADVRMGTRGPSPAATAARWPPAPRASSPSACSRWARASAGSHRPNPGHHDLVGFVAAQPQPAVAVVAVVDRHADGVPWISR